jgi:2-polyprenyl-3-methyl-5-hydroxy-6-metoxy-1,4-benzoquinol methylase
MPTNPYPAALTDQHYWQTVSSWYSDGDISGTSEFQRLFNRFLPQRSDWSVIEVGACPGNHLLALARSHGYSPVALDFLPAVQSLPAAFGRHGIALEVIEQDFLTLRASRRFNVVMSFGFVEHFTDVEDILRRHWALVADGGFLIVGVPTLTPMQMALRRLILVPGRLESVLAVHNTQAMDVRVLTRWCRQLPNATLVKCGYMSQMETWFYSSDPYVRRDRRWIELLSNVGDGRDQAAAA